MQNGIQPNGESPKCGVLEQCFDHSPPRSRIGSKAAPVCWLLRLGGPASDKQQGIADLQTTAERGHYLAPLARILLAIAYVREKEKGRAVQLLSALRDEYPNNPLFSCEIDRLQSAH